MSPSTVQQTLLGVRTKTFIDWSDDFTPALAPIPEHTARGTQSPCEAKAMKIPKCTLDAKWLENLAREIATTTPKILAHLEAKAKAQAKILLTPEFRPSIEETQYDLTQSKTEKQKSPFLSPNFLSQDPSPKPPKIPSTTFGNSLANSMTKHRFANGGTQPTKRKPRSTQTVSTPEFPPD